MPHGKGTYGSKVGRPRKKYNEGTDPENGGIVDFDNLTDRQQKITLVSLKSAILQPERADSDKIKSKFQNNFGEQIFLRERIKILEEYKNTRNQKQEGGPMSMDDQMQMAMGIEEQQLPDEEMEDNYLDFIIDEALSEEEEEMLMSKLEQDEQLSMLFDKVLEVASEFAGSGPVDGPGSGVSDSIPARLSDGEFVFTAKATEEIGADELMRMMKDAEVAADKRQELAMGGTPLSEEEKMLEEIETSDSKRVARKISDNMMDPYTQDRYVRS